MGVMGGGQRTGGSGLWGAMGEGQRTEGAACGGDGGVPGEQSCSATEAREQERALDGLGTAVGHGHQPCIAAHLWADTARGTSAHSFAALNLGRAFPGPLEGPPAQGLGQGLSAGGGRLPTVSCDTNEGLGAWGAVGGSQARAGPVWPSLCAHRSAERAVASAGCARASGVGDPVTRASARWPVPWEALWPHVAPSVCLRSLGSEGHPRGHRGQGGKELAETVSRGI